jgi:hypothetical protein
LALTGCGYLLVGIIKGTLLYGEAKSYPITGLDRIYRVIQEESVILWEMIVCVILSKNVHINMCPIFDGYGVMDIF